MLVVQQTVDALQWKCRAQQKIGGGKGALIVVQSLPYGVPETVERNMALKFPEALTCLLLFRFRHFPGVGKKEVRHGDVCPHKLHLQAEAAMAVCEFLFE